MHINLFWFNVKNISNDTRILIIMFCICFLVTRVWIYFRSDLGYNARTKVVQIHIWLSNVLNLLEKIKLNRIVEVSLHLLKHTFVWFLFSIQTWFWNLRYICNLWLFTIIIIRLISIPFMWNLISVTKHLNIIGLENVPNVSFKIGLFFKCLDRLVHHERIQGLSICNPSIENYF